MFLSIYHEIHSWNISVPFNLIYNFFKKNWDYEIFEIFIQVINVLICWSLDFMYYSKKNEKISKYIFKNI